MKSPACALAALSLLTLAACDGQEESALDQLANGANVTAVERIVKAEAQAVMEPLAPPRPGTPGGLPLDATPIFEGASDLTSAQAAAQVVEIYYGLLEQKLYADAQDMWGEDSVIGREKDDRFANRFRGFLEVHANVGAPSVPEAADGWFRVTVPVQVYGRLAINGKPWYALRQVTLRRVEEGEGTNEADRRWRIASIDPYAAPNETATAPAAISATDGMASAQ